MYTSDILSAHVLNSILFLHDSIKINSKMLSMLTSHPPPPPILNLVHLVKVNPFKVGLVDV